MVQLSQAVKDALVFYAKYKIAQTTAWAAENPARAMLYTAGGTAAMTNPTARGIVLKVAGHIAKQAAKDGAFYGRLILTDVLAPAARAGARGAGAAARAGGRLAVGAATTPAVAIPLVAVTAATAGGVASAAITSGINRQHNVPSSSPVSMWSPFGGFQLGTVV